MLGLAVPLQLCLTTSEPLVHETVKSLGHHACPACPGNSATDCPTASAPHQTGLSLPMLQKCFKPRPTLRELEQKRGADITPGLRGLGEGLLSPSSPPPARPPAPPVPGQH